MDLISLAISILWLCIGIILILGIIFIAFWAVEQFVPIPGPIKNGIWAIVLILILIAALTLLAGGGRSTLRGFHIGLSNPISVASGYSAHHLT